LGRAFVEAHHRPHRVRRLGIEVEHILLNRRSPAERDMQRFFGVTAPSAHQMMLTLERAGLIQRQPASRAASNCSSRPIPRLQPIQPVKSSVQRY
jgi:DNA-binding FadR family transcriptional regulator